MLIFDDTLGYFSVNVIAVIVDRTMCQTFPLLYKLQRRANRLFVSSTDLAKGFSFSIVHYFKVSLNYFGEVSTAVILPIPTPL